MDDDFIRREDAIEILTQKQRDICPMGRCGHGYVYGRDRDEYDAIEADIDAINNIPAADVSHVVHAQWEDVEVERVEDMENPPDVIAAMFCPNCKRWHNEVYFYGSPTENVHFCPFCGADMREPAVS